MRNSVTERRLILGIGNSSRSDDGLGWWLVDQLRTMGLDADIENRFQLNLEDAEYISNYDWVLFIDATSEEILEGYRLSEVTEQNHAGVFSHAVSPGMIKYLARTIFSASTQVKLLEISGEQWQIGEGLSKYAGKNGLNALRFLRMHFNITPDLTGICS